MGPIRHKEQNRPAGNKPYSDSSDYSDSKKSNIRAQSDSDQDIQFVEDLGRPNKSKSEPSARKTCVSDDESHSEPEILINSEPQASNKSDSKGKGKGKGKGDCDQAF